MKLVPTMIATAIAMTAAAGITLSRDVAQAANDTSKTSLVERPSSKFNLNKDDVQAVVDTERQERQAERRQAGSEQLTKRLDQAVTDGKITSAQKDLALTKHTEVQTQMEATRNLTDETARDEARDKLRGEMEKWAADNGIDATIIQPMRGEGRGEKGQGRHGGAGMMKAQAN